MDFISVLFVKASEAASLWSCLEQINNCTLSYMSLAYRCRNKNTPLKQLVVLQKHSRNSWVKSGGAMIHTLTPLLAYKPWDATVEFGGLVPLLVLALWLSPLNFVSITLWCTWYCKSRIFHVIKIIFVLKLIIFGQMALYRSIANIACVYIFVHLIFIHKPGCPKIF